MILENVLKERFGYSVFRPGQKEIITSILQGKDTIAMLPTGTGKSLCYQLPGLLLSGQVVVISPLLSLMQDQVEQLMMNGEKRVIAFNSFLTFEEKTRALNHLHQFKFIFLSPEMLRSEKVINRLKQIDIGLFVIDEAHCISQWGYDFRPDYIKLGEIRDQLGMPVTLALTATATPEVKDDIIASLCFDEWEEYIFSVDRPNISLAVEHIDSYEEKAERLIELVRNLAPPGIIYFSSKKMTEYFAALLKNRGIGEVMAYHGGMEQEARVLIQQQFIHDKLDVICATSAFGMGINKDNIRFVIHFHMPLQLESYLQEIGRAGRDGGKSIAILLYSPGDEQIPYQLAEGELPNEEQIDWLLQWAEEKPHILPNILSYEHEIRSIAGLTDIQWRLIAHFFQASDWANLQQNANQFKVFLRERLKMKQTKINDMYKWTQIKQCRRKNILKYFKEDRKIEAEECCDNCGINIGSFFQAAPRLKGIKTPFDWRKRLAEILINKRA